jgi:hypothetical protein
MAAAAAALDLHVQQGAHAHRHTPVSAHAYAPRRHMLGAHTVLSAFLQLWCCSADTLSSRCLSAIRKGGAAEVASAATALGEDACSGAPACIQSACCISVLLDLGCTCHESCCGWQSSSNKSSSSSSDSCTSLRAQRPHSQLALCGPLVQYLRQTVGGVLTASRLLLLHVCVMQPFTW